MQRGLDGSLFFVLSGVVIFTEYEMLRCRKEL